MDSGTPKAHTQTHRVCAFRLSPNYVSIDLLWRHRLNRTNLWCDYDGVFKVKPKRYESQLRNALKCRLIFLIRTNYNQRCYTWRECKWRYPCLEFHLIRD